MPALIRRRTRLLLFGLALLALLICAGAGIRLGARPARAQTAGDQSGQSLLLQLAERLLSAQTFVPGSPGVSPPIQLYPGALAPDFPAGVPLPPNSTLIGSEERPSYSSPPSFASGGSVVTVPSTASTPTGLHVDVVLDVPGSADDLMSFYKQALMSAGWTAPSSPSFGGFGFLSSSLPPQPTNYCRPDDHAQLAISARTTDSGPLDVRLSFDSGFSSVCNPQAASFPTFAGPIEPPGFGVMPGLAPPPGVRIITGVGAGGNASRVVSEAVAVTDMSVPDLHSFYAGELSGAGWTQLSSGGDDSLTWSTWSIPGHADLQGFLYVRDGPTSGQRSLHLEIGSTDPNAALNPGISSAVTTLPLGGSTGVDTGTPAPTNPPLLSATPAP